MKTLGNNLMIFFLALAVTGSTRDSPKRGVQCGAFHLFTNLLRSYKSQGWGMHESATCQWVSQIKTVIS